MKKIILFMFMMALLGTANAQSFTITGHIKGIEVGDTLRFDKVILPSWTMEKAFEIIVSSDGEFIYNGEHSHTQYYMMQYFPVDGIVPNTVKRELLILIRDGEIRVDGSRDLIYFATVSGGFYDSELRAIKALDDSLSIERTALRSFMDEVRRDADTVTVSDLTDRFNNFGSIKSVQYKRLRKMESDYAIKTGNEYVAANICETLWKPIEELEYGYMNLTDEAKKSYYGKLLDFNIEKIKNISAGKPAPDFTFKTLAGESISLSDFRGKYLIVYHFGLCPVSIYMDPLVVELYNNYRDKVEVIGLTESMQNLTKVSAEAAVNDEINGMNFKKSITNMTSHPWKYEAETTTDNNVEFLNTYNLTGMPTFLVVSPDGKIVTRGSNTAFYEAEIIIK